MRHIVVADAPPRLAATVRACIRRQMATDLAAAPGIPPCDALRRAGYGEPSIAALADEAAVLANGGGHA